MWRQPNQVLEPNWDVHEVNPVLGVVGLQVKDGGKKITGKIGLAIDYNKSNIRNGIFNYLKAAADSIALKPNYTVTFEQEYADRVMSSYEYERSQFFSENWRNADGHGLYNGHAVRRAGSGSDRKTAYYTFRIQAYN